MSDEARSLVEHFAPPGDLRGFAGWICGYSADAVALNSMTERFSGQGLKDRGRAGLPLLGLMLEPTHRQIPPTAVPGLLHLLAKTAEPPFRLMHAKVALLGFRDPLDPLNWSLRLLVSTGNWTRQTSQDSLDLVWRVDLEPADLDSDDPETLMKRADIAAAAEFMAWLRGLYQSETIAADAESGSPHGGPATEKFRALDDWLARVASSSSLPPPRFFDTRARSIIDQLPGLVGNASGNARRRNCLVIGSGFYEGPSSNGGLPRVPERVRAMLRGEGFLTAKSHDYLVLEPTSCQLLAADGMAAVLTKEHEWHLLAAGQPYEGLQLRLHAKFLFSANWRAESDRCSSAWVYIGSGNLTDAGFLQAASRTRGNLEAGVVFAADGLRWEGERNERDAITTLLPIDWHLEIDGQTVLTGGAERPETGPAVVASPVTHLLWRTTDGGGQLSIPQTSLSGDGLRTVSARPSFDVIDPNGTPCSTDQGRFLWPHAQPAQVNVQFDLDAVTRVVLVPVQDIFGRLAGQSLDPIGFDMAIDRLATFPFAQADDPAPPSGAPPDPIPPVNPDHKSPSIARHPGSVGLAIRQTMQLIEGIAECQVSIPAEDWHSWCSRLDCVLCQIGNDDPVFAELRRIGLNPLAVLRQDPFLPEHARQSGPTRERLDAALVHVEEAWGVRELTPLGETAAT
jgi:hypothetical protein